MNPHFFTAPFYFAFIWFKVQVAASPPFLEDGRKPLPSFLMRAELSFIARLATFACAAHYS